MSWQQRLAQANAFSIERFGQAVVLHRPDGDQNVRGVFDAPEQLFNLKGGGSVREQPAQLQLLAELGSDLTTGSQLTVAEQRWYITKPPLTEYGLTTLILGVSDDRQPKPVIRY